MNFILILFSLCFIYRADATGTENVTDSKKFPTAAITKSKEATKWSQSKCWWQCGRWPAYKNCAQEAYFSNCQQMCRSNNFPKSCQNIRENALQEERKVTQNKLKRQYNPNKPLSPKERELFNAIEDGPLVSYLSSIEIPSGVKSRADQGYQRYSNPQTGLKKARDGSTGAGRKPTWIMDTFGETEEAIISKLEKIDGPMTWTIEQIDKAYQDQLAKTNPSLPKNEIPTIFLVKGVGVNYLHESPLGEEAILQLASQFNYLESMSSNKAKVSEYLYDRTQGPQGSIEAAAAALHRTAAENVGKLPHALTDVLPTESASYYRNGYLELFKVPNLENLYQYIEARIPQLRILPQWVECEPSGHMQLQVFSAAPSYQGRDVPAPDSWGGKVCEALVSAQYEAIAKLAVIRSLKTNKVVNLHLTLVGQGVFNNPPSALATALKKVADIVRGQDNVHVYIHAFGESDVEKVRKASAGKSFRLQDMGKEEFMQGMKK